MAKKKSIFQPAHLYTVLFAIPYFILLNVVFITLVSSSNIYVFTLGPLAFGEFTALTFLYLFSHKDYFSFIGWLEKKQKAKENTYLEKYVHYGKFIACVIIAWVGGPFFLALSVRLLFSATSNRYLITFLATMFSTLFGVALAKGLLSFL